MDSADLSFFRSVLGTGFKPFFPETFPLIEDGLIDYMMSNLDNTTRFDVNHGNDIVAFREVREMLRLETWDWNKPVITPQYLEERINKKLMSLAVTLVPGLDTNFLTTLSSEHYESASAKNLAIVLLPSLATIKSIDGSVEFHKNNHYDFASCNAHAIRKQLNTGGKMLLAAAYNCENDNGYYKTIGLVPPRCLCDYYSVVIVGHAHWKLCYPNQNANDILEVPPKCASVLQDNIHGFVPDCITSREQRLISSVQCLIQYKNGMFRFPTLDIGAEIKNRIHIAFSSIDENQVDLITNIIARIIKEADRGTVVVFSDPQTIAFEAEHLVEKSARGVCFQDGKLQNLTNASDGIIKSFSSVDGAILVDTFGFCHAFGVILDGKVPRGRLRHGKRIPGKPSRGAKYNCTKTYVHSLLGKSKETLGVVISEDGMVDLIPDDKPS